MPEGVTADSDAAGGAGGPYKPVVLRVKRKRGLEPVDAIIVEAEESQDSKRRARGDALATEMEAAFASFGVQVKGQHNGAATTTSAGALEASSRPSRRRLVRLSTLSAADARDPRKVQTVVESAPLAASRKRPATEQPEVSSAAEGANGSTDAGGACGANKRASHFQLTGRRSKRGGGGVGPTGEAGGRGDSMSELFDLYDIIATGQAEEEDDAAGQAVRERRQRKKEARAAQERMQQEAALLCNFLPMVREYVGDKPPSAAAQTIIASTPALRRPGVARNLPPASASVAPATGVAGAGSAGSDQVIAVEENNNDGSDGDDDEYVYDVFVAVKGNEAGDDIADAAMATADPNGELPDPVIRLPLKDWSNADFDASDHDDYDSEDSNREDDPHNDYPDEDDDWDCDSDNPEHDTAFRYRGGYGVGGGVFSDGEEYEDGYDFHGYYGGGGGMRHDGGSYNDIAYDPEFDREASDDEGHAHGYY